MISKAEREKRRQTRWLLVPAVVFVAGLSGTIWFASAHTSTGPWAGLAVLSLNLLHAFAVLLVLPPLVFAFWLGRWSQVVLACFLGLALLPLVVALHDVLALGDYASERHAVSVPMLAGEMLLGFVSLLSAVLRARLLWPSKRAHQVPALRARGFESR